MQLYDIQKKTVNIMGTLFILATMSIFMKMEKDKIKCHRINIMLDAFSMI